VEAVVTTIVGLVGGLALSAAFWYWTVHIIRPSLEFSTNISRIVNASGETLYRVRVRNLSRRRGVIDLTFGVTLRYPERAIRPDAATSSFNSIKIETRNDGIFRLSPRTRQLVVMDLKATLDSNRNRGIIAALYPVVPQRSNLDLEALLRRSEGAYIVVRLLGYDQWSGARRYFESRHYQADDIKQGYFDGVDIV
jgi:hypothetical protein